jgi:hypothetical protein
MSGAPLPLIAVFMVATSCSTDFDFPVDVTKALATDEKKCEIVILYSVKQDVLFRNHKRETDRMGAISRFKRFSRNSK